MTFLYDVLVILGGLILLWLFFKLFGGCILRLLLFLIVLAGVIYVIFYVIGC